VVIQPEFSRWTTMRTGFYLCIGWMWATFLVTLIAGGLVMLFWATILLQLLSAIRH
jgi:hypothetical protein